MKRVIIISVAGLRCDAPAAADMLNMGGLARDALAFHQAVAPAPLTLASLASVLTGLQPYRHGLRQRHPGEALSARASTLAESMRAAGFATTAFIAATGLEAAQDMFRGFASVRHCTAEAGGLDAAITASTEWIGQQGGNRAFLLLHCEVEPGQDGLRRLDHQLGRLFDWLRARALLDDTLLALVSLHGAAAPREAALLAEPVQHVPLILRHPMLGPARAIGQQVGLVDLAPTLLDLCGIAATGLDGHSLRAVWQGGPAETRPAYMETLFREQLSHASMADEHLHGLRGVRIDGRYKVIWECANERVEVYDLARDPGEQSPTVFSPWPAPMGATRRECRKDAIRERSAGMPALARQWRLVESVADLVCADQGADLILTGSLAAGNADAYSDIDLEVICDSPATRSRIKQAVTAHLADAGEVVAQFPATHLHMPELMIHFLNIDETLVKIDLHYVLAAPDADNGAGLQLVGAATERPAPPARWQPGAGHYHDLYNKFCGWMWYTHTKIERGEYWEAEDSLGVMRSYALMPFLQLVRGQPSEGYRRVEQRFAPSDRDRLAVTRCHSQQPEELRRVMFALSDFFEELVMEAAGTLGAPLHGPDIGTMKRLIGRSTDTAR